jgi:gamma-glutamylcyclotransferase (GGCT)/AIG2-like uncharacterized protein YtfP
MIATNHVFVYGTLKPGECNYDRYCRNKTLLCHRAYIRGQLYDFPQLGYPGATVGNGRVEGFVLSLLEPSVLVDLDDLEDYDPQGRSADNMYTRQLVSTYTLDGRVGISAWVYFMTPDRVRQLGGVAIPHGWWGN